MNIKQTSTLTDKGIELAIKSIEIVENIDNDFFSKLDMKDKNKLNLLFSELLL